MQHVRESHDLMASQVSEDPFGAIMARYEEDSTSAMGRVSRLESVRKSIAQRTYSVH